MPRILLGESVLLAAVVGLMGCVGDSPSVTPDSGAPDSASDASVDTGTSFCTGKAYPFCADFDLGPAPESGWSLGKTEKLGGAVTFDQTTFVSSPRGMASKLPAISGAAYTYAASAAHVVQLQGKTTSRVTLDIYPKGPAAFVGGDCLLYFGMQANGIGGIAFMQRKVVADAGATEWLVYRSLTTSSSPHLMSFGLALSKWNHVVEEVHWANDATGSIVVSIDGTETLRAQGVPTTEAPVPQTVRVSVGLENCLGNGQPATVSFDNVFVELL